MKNNFERQKGSKDEFWKKKITKQKQN